jgi:hypothetical protein
MTTEPYASARRVFWVVDNGSSHIGARSVERMHLAWPNAQLVHLPVHASWLNQIEVVFSVIQRKVVRPADFADLAALADRLERFEDRYNQTARPFDWRFTRTDLTAMLDRLEVHRPHDEVPSPPSTSASGPTSPTSTASTPTGPSKSCAGSAGAASSTPGASPSTGPATTTTKTATSPTA